MPRVLISMLLVTAAFTVPAGAEVISLDMPLVPASTLSNQLSVTLTADISGSQISDSEISTLTGNLLTEVEVYFDPTTQQVAAVSALEFTGGLVEFSDMSFILSFGLLGRVNADSSNVAGIPDSPQGPGAVTAGQFSALDHVLLLNQGVFVATGTGIVGGLLDPVTIDLADDPMQASADAQGSITVTLDSFEDNQATYTVSLLLPVAFYEIVMSDDTVTVTVEGSGVMEAEASFTRFICPLASNLTGEKCQVDMADVAEFCRQWLSSADPANCILTADLYGSDCTVDFADFTVLLADWLLCLDPTCTAGR